MRPLLLALALSCGPAAQTTTTVEIAQPLPTAQPTATASSPVVVARPVDVAEARDPRPNTARQRQLVATEVWQLEQLLAATAANSPDRVSVRRRLAEDYVELRKGGAPDASRKAIAQYDALIRESPNYPKLDEALYYLSLEYEHVNEMANARRTSFDLIRKQPSSPLVPYAYFAFAELFFNEAQTDPSKWMMAQEAYTQVLKYPHTPIAPEAVYRLMLVFKGMGDDARAEEMKQRILRDYPTSAAASRVTSS